MIYIIQQGRPKEANMYKILFFILSLAFAQTASADNHIHSTSHVTFSNSIFDFSSISEIDKRLYTVGKKRRVSKAKRRAKYIRKKRRTR